MGHLLPHYLHLPHTLHEEHKKNMKTQKTNGGSEGRHTEDVPGKLGKGRE